MTTQKPTDIYIAVQETYTAVALDSASCCGTNTSCCNNTLADLDLTDIASGAVISSRGCGNPQAIAALQPGQTVLDLGSGGGLDCFLAARQVGPTGKVYGVDMTDAMLELATRNAAEMGLTQVEFRKGFIEQLPMPDDAVDVILSNCVINLSPDKPAVLREAFRVLKSGGRLAFSDVVIDGTLSDLSVDEATLRSSLSWSGCIGGALTVDEFRAALAQAGFVDIRITCTQHYAPGDLYGMMPENVEIGLSDAEKNNFAAIIGRFASADIRATKPAAGCCR
jgi:SAM-dependent methyltransferase